MWLPTFTLLHTPIEFQTSMHIRSTRCKKEVWETVELRNGRDSSIVAKVWIFLLSFMKFSMIFKVFTIPEEKMAKLPKGIHHFQCSSWKATGLSQTCIVMLCHTWERSPAIDVKQKIKKDVHIAYFVVMNGNIIILSICKCLFMLAN